MKCYMGENTEKGTQNPVNQEVVPPFFSELFLLSACSDLLFERFLELQIITCNNVTVHISLS